MKVIAVFKRLLASGNDQHGRHLFKWGNRWNILGFNFTKRDALSSVYKISMKITYKHYKFHATFLHRVVIKYERFYWLLTVFSTSGKDTLLISVI